MSKSVSVLLGIIVSTAAVAAAGVASAQTCPTSQVVLLFDRSNSMNDNGSTGDPKWEIGRDKALADFAALSPGTEVAVMSFGNPPPIGSSPYVQTIIGLPAAMKKGTNDTALLAAIDVASVPDYWNTPVAGGTCDAIDEVWLDEPSCMFSTARQVYLYTDGLENSTPTSHACYSTISSSTPFDASLAGAGFGLEAGSWERKLANKAWTGSPDVDNIPGVQPIIVSVAVLFDWINRLATPSDDLDGAPVGSDLQSLDANAVAFYSGIAEVTSGSYFEAKQIGGVPTVIPVPGDTDPSPTYSCVEYADISRVIEAFGHVVADGDPLFSREDLAQRDVNNDLIINAYDYYVVVQNYGTCA